jgi:diphthamide synthase (EF-2-diphthine--ammonia ligase)
LLTDVEQLHAVAVAVRGDLARTFVKLGFQARAVCVDPRVLDRSFVGRNLNQQFFDDLPKSVDPCGENGEFHSFVYDGPIFRRPMRCKTGEVVERDSFVFCDLLSDEEVRA